jgi:hypothetical protein
VCTLYFSTRVYISVVVVNLIVKPKQIKLLDFVVQLILFSNFNVSFCFLASLYRRDVLIRLGSSQQLSRRLNRRNNSQIRLTRIRIPDHSIERRRHSLSHFSSITSGVFLAFHLSFFLHIHQHPSITREYPLVFCPSTHQYTITTSNLFDQQRYSSHQTQATSNTSSTRTSNHV